MEIEIKRQKTETVAEGGIPFCEVTIALPCPIGEGEACERVRRFYDALSRETLALAREVVLPYARGGYERSQDPRRRFTHRPYRLALTATLRTKEGVTEVRRTLTLSHRGKEIAALEAAERITEDGEILPKKRERKAEKRKKMRDAAH